MASKSQAVLSVWVCFLQVSNVVGLFLMTLVNESDLITLTLTLTELLLTGSIKIGISLPVLPACITKASLTSHCTCTYVLVAEKNQLVCRGH